MTQKLTDFLTKLATDDHLVLQFEQDAAGTMEKHGVPDDHIKLVLEQKIDEIQELLGANYEIVANGIIKTFKPQ